MASDMSPTDPGHLNHLDTKYEPITKTSASTTSTSINGPDPVLDTLIDESVVDAKSDCQVGEKDTLSELFEELEQLVGSPPPLINVAHGQPAPEPFDSYNPSLITPGAPCLPSARHKIAKLPYHLSTDHHSASLFLSNSSTSPESLTEGSPMVPRKRPYPARHHEETPRKRFRQPPQDDSSQIQRISPQKRRHIFNDPEVSDCKRPRTWSKDHSATSENDSSSQPQANTTNHTRGIELDGPVQQVNHEPQANTQTQHTLITQLAYQTSQNHDTTNHLPSSGSPETSKINVSSHLNPKYVEHSSDAAHYHSDEPNPSSTRFKSGSSPPGHLLDLPPESGQRTVIEAHSQESMTRPAPYPQKPPAASTSYQFLTPSPPRSQAHQQPKIGREKMEYDHTYLTE
ncbi:uncharacterized protein MELLADRAFT_114453 [Melampsora larici-populina 98AG31]|uniref:Uncharacterized protein n=1 Tax=Melampsora larici-populina (strain 98AG31 / pathotype 3-4-7) TaxID=747676 RepID=F4SDI9_MELLP|nr:uncharacterized protein MELLADRAFT_114453 [Melampsora larici-populina 98AG31]EGF97287.1 hypothetical protein MELLADRAFT_114453 [Melampsora larici-populina 98AG31]